MSVPKHISIGRVKKLHGVKGQVSIELDFALIQDFPPYLLIGNKKPIPYFIKAVNDTGKGDYLVSLEDVDDRSEAEKLKGMDLFIKEKDFDQYFEADENELPELEGFQLFDEHGSFIGEMIEYQELPQQVLIVAQNNGREVLIPLQPDTVVSIDQKDKSASLKLPEGLLDLYL
jgi:16S rRNA processing protein RimM